MEERNKTLAVKESVHARLVGYAKENGLHIQGLTERIITDYFDALFFAPKASLRSNRKKQTRQIRG